MSIAPYLKEIARGRKGARDLSRVQAADLMAQLLRGDLSELELGAFCIAMRIKGETPDELAGFLDALTPHMQRPRSTCPVVVLPSYSGARRQPCLTPLLALHLAQLGQAAGFAVLLHGMQTEDSRVAPQSIIFELNKLADPMKPAWAAIEKILPTRAEPLQAGRAYWLDTADFSPALARLLQVREVLGLRNSAHSLVKMLNPVDAPLTVLVYPYTHPEYRESAAATFLLTGQRALLMRGTEGEPVADTRRLPEIRLAQGGTVQLLQAPQDCADDVATQDCSAVSTAAYSAAVLQGQQPLPSALARQAALIIESLKT